MAKYNLQANEYVILKNNRVLHGGARASYTDELILTNLNIVLIKKGIFNKVKNIQTYPVNQIKVFDGNAQAKLGKQRSGFPQLEKEDHQAFLSIIGDLLEWLQSLKVNPELTFENKAVIEKEGDQDLQVEYNRGFAEAILRILSKKEGNNMAFKRRLDQKKVLWNNHLVSDIKAGLIFPAIRMVNRYNLYELGVFN